MANIPKPVANLIAVDLAWALEISKEHSSHGTPESIAVAKSIVNALNQYKDGAINYYQFRDIAIECGMPSKKVDLTVGDIDYGKIVTFEEALQSAGEYDESEDDEVPSLSYSFEGEPAHPELFNILVEEGDRFAGKTGFTQGTFKCQCPKIGGQKFAFTFNASERRDNGDFWIEFSDKSKLGIMNTIANGGEAYNRFEIRQIQYGKLYSMRSDGVLLEALLSMAPVDEEYELAFVDGIINQDGEFEELSTKPLTKEEISIFKSYIRAFKEALDGKGEYVQDLERFASQQQNSSSKKGGCFGILLLPFLGLGALSYLLF